MSRNSIGGGGLGSPSEERHPHSFKDEPPYLTGIFLSNGRVAPYGNRNFYILKNHSFRAVLGIIKHTE